MFAGALALRAFIARALSPAFEAAVRRFDPAIEFREHVAFAQRVLASQVPAMPGPAPVVRSVEARVRSALGLAAQSDFKHECDAAEMAALEAELLVDVSASAQRLLDIGVLGLLDEAQLPAAQRAGDPGKSMTHLSPPDWESLRTLHAQTAPLQAGLRRGLLCETDAFDAIWPALEQREPRHWFLVAKGVRYGSADLLRSAVGLLGREIRGGSPAASGPELRDYLRETLDRLIRHVEVRREAALGFAPESLPPEADSTLERLRFTLALLEGARVFADVRYLNTALKLDDWHLRVLRRDRGAASDPRVASRFLHYLVALSAQEEHMQEIFP